MLSMKKLVTNSQAISQFLTTNYERNYFIETKVEICGNMNLERMSSFGIMSVSNGYTKYASIALKFIVFIPGLSDETSAVEYSIRDTVYDEDVTSLTSFLMS